MKKREDIEARTEELIAPILAENGVSLYDAEYVKEGSDFFLRVYIEKDGGVTIDDCETVSRAMNEVLDKEDYIDGSYVFEVSSPGLTRKLTKDRHFEKNLGETVELKLYKAIEKEKEFRGELTAFDKDTVTLRLEDGVKKQFERQGIASIRLALDF